MREYQITGHALFLDLDEARIALRNVELSVGTRRLVVPSVDLDTGLTAGLFGPLDELETLLGEDWSLREWNTLGGPIQAHSAWATMVLRKGLLTQRIEVIAARGADRWLLGLPVIRAFDLLLREGRAHGPVAVLSPR
jgi:hypothetical protein